MITVESVPRNNPPRTEREKKINPSTPHQRQAFQRLQMYRSRPALPADCTIRLCAHSCPPHLKISLWSHLKTIISFPLVTLPPLASQRPTAMLTVFSRECFFFLRLFSLRWTAPYTRLWPEKTPILCDRQQWCTLIPSVRLHHVFSIFPLLHRRNFHSTFSENRSPPSSWSAAAMGFSAYWY